MWDIFGMERLGDEEHGIPGDEGQRAHDLLMAEIAAVVSKGMRHVVAPPSAVWRHKEEEAAGGGDAGPGLCLYPLLRQSYPELISQFLPSTTLTGPRSSGMQVETLQLKGCLCNPHPTPVLCRVRAGGDPAAEGPSRRQSAVICIQ